MYPSLLILILILLLLNPPIFLASAQHARCRNHHPGTRACGHVGLRGRWGVGVRERENGEERERGKGETLVNIIAKRRATEGRLMDRIRSETSGGHRPATTKSALLLMNWIKCNYD